MRELSQSDERWVEIKEIEKMKQTNNILNGGIINFFFIAFSYSAQLYTYSNVGKKFTYTTTIATSFLYIVVLKIAF